MAKRGKYDLVLVSENGNEMEYIVTDFNLNDIDALCSAYKSEVDYLISLSQKGIDIKNGHLVIYDYKGFKYQTIFGNNILRSSSINTYEGVDSYGKKRLKVHKSEEIDDIVNEFIKILTTEDGQKFSKTGMGKTCVTKGILNKVLRYNDLNIRNSEGNFDSSEEILEMNELANNIIKDIYIYKNLRGIIVFIDRFKKRDKYFYKKDRSSKTKKEPISVSNAEYKPSNEMSPTEEFAKNWEILTDKEEILEEGEIRQAYGYDDDGDYGYPKIR